jgi:hypothetical protein
MGDFMGRFLGLFRASKSGAILGFSPLLAFLKVKGFLAI